MEYQQYKSSLNKGFCAMEDDALNPPNLASIAHKFEDALAATEQDLGQLPQLKQTLDELNTDLDKLKQAVKAGHLTGLNVK
ncbi:hypothetical protein C2869_18020 [Saccharobesus litoralis]|uniref:Uncharacterized protein n=1 Tax=Saccharobesus litoralis TaxID=2172099 RepID=A0A2S0VVE6_9ALTE|nr:hypothetical protein [Saccharobesus litoralis]AWB68191.1 hypothetical protein C2869_18020 [Saccharobesus litoralis]